MIHRPEDPQDVWAMTVWLDGSSANPTNCLKLTKPLGAQRLVVSTATLPEISIPPDLNVNVGPEVNRGRYVTETAIGVYWKLYPECKAMGSHCLTDGFNIEQAANIGSAHCNGEAARPDERLRQW